MTSTDIVAEATTPQPLAEPSNAASAASTDPAQVAVEPELAGPEGPQRLLPNGRLRHIVGMTAWGAAFLIAWLTIGIPTDPVEAFVWIFAATIAWNNDKPWRSHLRFLRDWAAVVILLVVYNISRGWAASVTPHVTPMIDADKWLFGWATGGKIPTMWLQEHLYHIHHVQWYEVMASFVYFSHFVMALIVAAVLWMSNRDRWLRFVRRWFALTAMILATYFLYPAAPPWWASQTAGGAGHGAGYLPGPFLQDPSGPAYTVVRLSTRGWDALGLHHAGSLLNVAQVQEANPVAAMPSMHSAYALLIVAFFLPSVRKRWWPLMLCYPLAMTFALVYSGEHYMIDVLMGWTYVGITFVGVWAGERLWAAYKARRAAARSLVPAVAAGTAAPAVAFDGVAAPDGVVVSGPALEPVPEPLIVAQRDPAAEVSRA
jgi:PAP2 superfamily